MTDDADRRASTGRRQLNRKEGGHRGNERRYTPRLPRDISMTQQGLADMLGIDRTSVTKILNQDPNHLASPDTVARVWAAAEQYGLTGGRNIEKRRVERASVYVPVAFTIVLCDGAVFTEGSGIIINVSEEGCLLVPTEVTVEALPLMRSEVIMTFVKATTESGARGVVLRQTPESDGYLPLGIHFLEFTGAGEAFIHAAMTTGGQG